MDDDEVIRLMKAIAAQGHEALYLPQTRAELEALGITGLGEKALGPMTVRQFDPKSDTATVYCCTVILPGQMLSLPDNATAPCAWGCGRTIQFRPWAPAELVKVCLYCAAERKKDDN